MILKAIKSQVSEFIFLNNYLIYKLLFIDFRLKFVFLTTPFSFKMP
jgi:hypothetical protein